MNTIETVPAAPAKARTRCAWTAEERAEWVRLLEESGQGLSEFCRANGLPESTVSLWRKQLREPATETSDEAGFIEVALPVPPVDVAPPLRVTIRLAHDVALEVAVGTDPTWLTELIQRLRSQV